MPSGRFALFYWSGGVWFAVLIFIPMLIPLASIASRKTGVPMPLGVPIALYFLLLAQFWLTRRSFLRSLRAHWLAVCPTCLYPLKMESGRCPECGRVITRREARMFWFGILFNPFNVLKSESKVLRDGQIWRDQRRDRIRIMNWRFGPLARRQRASPGPPPSMS